MALKIRFKNFLDNATSFLRNDNTGARTYQFQDQDDTMIGMKDLLLPSTTDITADTVLALTNINKIVEVNAAGNVNLTVPTNASVAFPVGQILYFRRKNSTGSITLVAADGTVTVTGTSGLTTDPGQNIIFSIRQLAANVWEIQNGLSGAWINWNPGNLVGFSVQPTGVTCRYKELDSKTFVFFMNMTGAGTSNAVNFTVTLPFIAKQRQQFTIVIEDSGSFLHGDAYTVAGSTDLQIWKIGGANMTATGNKGAWIGAIVIEKQ